jgi:hypothetical protein
VLGIRELAPSFQCLNLENEKTEMFNFLSNIEDCSNSLFAIPLCCNFSGKKMSLELVKTIKRSKPNVKTLIDAAAFVPISKLDLSQCEGLCVCLLSLLFMLIRFFFFL